MPRLPATLLACLALAGGAVAGCGDDDEDTTSNATPPPAATTPTAKAASRAVVAVGMKNIKFVPANISVRLGQKVKWTNTDGDIAHTVTSQTKGEDFDSGTLQGGATFEYTPKKVGTINYVCTIHSGQTGTISVVK